MMLTIGLSYAPADNEKYNRYREAVREAARLLDEEVALVDLAAHPNRLTECDGVIFTGGSDIEPSRYGKQTEERLCTGIDAARDQAEFELASKVEENRIPILGICRGLQLLNVHRGGTLVTDIQTFGGRDHTKIDGHDRRHRVKIETGSYLRGVFRASEGEINSSHHQAAERLGEGLIVTARAVEDGTVEALEWADPKGKPFFLAVQWHPERMEFDEPFAGRIFESFLWEVAAHKTLRSRL